MPRINFIVDDQQKGLFEEYVESDPEFESLSHFFRVAAIREMSEDDERDEELQSEIIERLELLEADVEDIKTELKGINARLDSSGADIELIAEDIRQTLHTLPQPSTAEITQSDKSADELRTQFAYDIISQDYPTTIDDLTHHLEEDRDNIEDAIEHLKSQHIPLVEKVLDGEKHYFKEGERR
ncbi:MAG: hypothetical protein ABEH77_05935 [Halobacteriaceae archaeon]